MTKASQDEARDADGADRPMDGTMRPDLYGSMYRLERDYWWHVGKRMIVRRLLARHLPSAGEERRRVLDLGCGTGVTLDDLTRYGTAFGLDSAPLALEYCRVRGHRALVRAIDLPFRPASFDLVTALDVIEHVEDDRQTLRIIGEVLRPGGLLVISVPAYERLWSYWDEMSGHRRRYTARRLGDVAESAGLEVLRLSYTNLLILLPAAVVRLLKGRRRVAAWRPSGPGLTSEAAQHGTDFMSVPGWLNQLLRGYYAVESRVIAAVGLPCGLSVVCVARKPAP